VPIGTGSAPSAVADTMFASAHALSAATNRRPLTTVERDNRPGKGQRPALDRWPMSSHTLHRRRHRQPSLTARLPQGSPAGKARLAPGGSRLLRSRQLFRADSLALQADAQVKVALPFLLLIRGQILLPISGFLRPSPDLP
jgi:hypothetical protein